MSPAASTPRSVLMRFFSIPLTRIPPADARRSLAIQPQPITPPPAFRHSCLTPVALSTRLTALKRFLTTQLVQTIRRPGLAHCRKIPLVGTTLPLALKRSLAIRVATTTRPPVFKRSSAASAALTTPQRAHLPWPRTPGTPTPPPGVERSLATRLAPKTQPLALEPSRVTPPAPLTPRAV